MLDISQGQLMVLLLHLFSGNAGNHYRAAANGSRTVNSGGIVQWPEAVTHLLQTNATEAAIGEAVDNLLHVPQNETKPKRLTQPVSTTQPIAVEQLFMMKTSKITVYVKGSLLFLSKIVSRFGNATPSLRNIYGTHRSVCAQRRRFILCSSLLCFFTHSRFD